MNMDFAAGLSFLGPRDISGATRARVDKLVTEVSSGFASDTGRALHNDFSEYSRLLHTLETNSTKSEAVNRALTWGQATQAALTQIDDANGRVQSQLAAGGWAADQAGFQLLTDTARGATLDIVSALNTDVAGRYVFMNGRAEPAMADAEAILADVHALAASAASYQDYAAAVDSYFDGGGALDIARAADPGSRSHGVQIGANDSVEFDLDHQSPEVRTALKQSALIAGLSGAGFGLTQSDRIAFTEDLSRRQAEAGQALPLAAGKVGNAQQRLDGIKEALDAVRLAAEARIGELTGVDPFEASTRLQAEMSRLETLYAITARRADLRLTNFLR